MKFVPIILAFTVLPAVAQAQGAFRETGTYPIAGLNPGERPVGAPVIKNVEHSKEWKSNFFRGISKPYPPNLGTAANWGNWYVPFDQPGMPGRYDIRGWHTEKNTAKRAEGKKP